MKLSKQVSNYLTILLIALEVVLLSSLPSGAQTTPPGNIMNQRVIGEQKILFIRVQYPGDDGGIVSDAGMQHIAAVIKETLETNSYGAVRITTDITPVLMMPQPQQSYQFDEARGAGATLTRIRADAIALAEQAGFPEVNYDREVIYTKKLWNGAAIGLGTVNFRTSFVACTCDYLTVHELGHSFDWKHANLWRVTEGSPISPDGKEINYGDAFDIMGDQIPGRGRTFHHFNPWFKSRTGWLPVESILTVTENGTYTVQALEKPPDVHSPRRKYSALRIKKDAETDYWVFYRAEEEFANTGALISMGFHSNRKTSLLLDMTPGHRSDEWKDAALTVGHVFYDPYAGVEVKLLSKTADELKLQVSVPPGAAGNVPVIDVLQPAKGRTVGGTVRYEATAFDPDHGTANGAGIARMKLELENTLAHDSASVFASAERFVPPYVLDVDTKALNDDVYFLLVTAISADGDTNTIRFEHIIDNTGPSFPTSVAADPTISPDKFQLSQSYPNPFNPATTIRYSLDRGQFVSLKIYDSLGREVRTLVSREQPGGSHEVRWDGRDSRGKKVASGTYLYRLVAGSAVRTKTMLLMR